MSRRMMILFFAVVAAQVVGLVAFVGARQVAFDARGERSSCKRFPLIRAHCCRVITLFWTTKSPRLPERERDAPEGSVVYVTLRECGEVWCADRYSTWEPEPPDVFIRGRVTDRRRLDFAIGTFFVPEGTGRIVERGRDVKVVVSLNASGSAVIKQVLVDGRPFDPEAR